MKRQLFLMMATMVCAIAAEAKVQLPQLFQSGMVLQRDKLIPVWGKADPQEKVIISWNKREYTTVADAEGHWRIDLPKTKTGGPYTMTVHGSAAPTSDTIELTDILVGDVWLCSGQSNIDVTIERVYPQYSDEIDHFNNNKIRLFRVQNDTDTHGVRDDIRPTPINWKPLTKQNAWLFSAVGTFLGLRMFEQTNVPQGIIVNSWGGTPIEAWISVDSLIRDYPLLVEKTRLYQDDELVAAQQKANQRASERWSQLLNEKDPFPQDDTEWPVINQYALTTYLAPFATHNNYIGSVWLRQHLFINKERAGKAARFLLGTLFDQDYTYVNGREVGRTYYQYPPRRYQIPEGLLHEGDNIITIRFINKYGIPHFIKDKPYMLVFGDGDTLRLSEEWKVQPGVQMPSCPSGDVSLQNMPTTLYNAVLHPLAPYALSGVVWYQGESNVGNPTPYADLLKKMMGCWRDRWQDPQMPFCIVQLANYDPNQQSSVPTLHPRLSKDSNWARLRDAQRIAAANDPYAELACIIDLGETVDIHPLRKKEVAERIGRCMDRLVFGKKVSLSPQVVSQEVNGTVISITFDQPLRTASLNEVEVAGEDNSFANAEAEANGNRIVIQSPIPSPVKVRYAWKDDPARANLYGENGLPAVPFEITVK